MRNKLHVVCVLACAVAFCPRAGATGPAELEQARAHVTTAKRSYHLGEFQDALKAFKEAYRLTDDPNLLFNIGQCQWKLGEDRAALHSYRAYLRSGSDLPVRKQVELRIAELERKIKEAELAAAGRAAQPAPPGPAPTNQPSAASREATAQPATADRAATQEAPRQAAIEKAVADNATPANAGGSVAIRSPQAPQPSRARRNAGVILCGAGLVALGVGTYFGLRAIDDADKGDRDSFNTAAWGANLGIGAGILAAGIGGYLLLTLATRADSDSSNASRIAVAPVVGSSTGGLIIEGNW